MLAMQAEGARQTLEAALRRSDGGHLPKGWPDKYEAVIRAILAALEPGELVQGAWRTKSLGSRRMRKGVGLILVTDRRVLGADQSSKGSGGFAVAASDVATVALVPNHMRDIEAGYDIVSGWKISLLGEDGAILGSEDSSAEFQVFTRGGDPSNWDDHVRGEKDLGEVQDSIVQLLPAARASSGESAAMPVAQALPVAPEALAPPTAVAASLPSPAASGPGGPHCPACGSANTAAIDRPVPKSTAERIGFAVVGLVMFFGTLAVGRDLAFFGLADAPALVYVMYVIGFGFGAWMVWDAATGRPAPIINMRFYVKGWETHADCRDCHHMWVTPVEKESARSAGPDQPTQ